MIVVDSSAVIALLNKETGAAFIADHLSEAVISAVNLQEIVKKMLDAGYVEGAIREAVEGLELRIAAHEAEDAYLAASLTSATRQFGRGLGDRSCMALAIRLGVPAITTDRMWARLDIPGLEVILAR